MLTPHPYTPENPAQAYLCNFSFSRALFIHSSIYLSIYTTGRNLLRNLVSQSFTNNLFREWWSRASLIGGGDGNKVR